MLKRTEIEIELLAREFGRAEVRRSWPEETVGLDNELLRKAEAAGLTVGLPSIGTDGSEEDAIVALMLISKGLSYSNAKLGLACFGSGLAALSAGFHGSKAQRKDLSLSSRETVKLLSIAPPIWDPDVEEVVTSCHVSVDGEDCLLSGDCIPVVAGQAGEWCVVFAGLEQPRQASTAVALLVDFEEACNAGTASTVNLEDGGLPIRHVAVRGLQVPSSRILHENIVSQATLDRVFVAFQTCLASSALGIAESACEDCDDYLKRLLDSPDRPVKNSQEGTKVAALKTECRAAELLLLEMGRRLDSGKSVANNFAYRISFALAAARRAVNTTTQLYTGLGGPLPLQTEVRLSELGALAVLSDRVLGLPGVHARFGESSYGEIFF